MKVLQAFSASRGLFHSLHDWHSNIHKFSKSIVDGRFRLHRKFSTRLSILGYGYSGIMMICNKAILKVQASDVQRKYHIITVSLYTED